MAVALALTAAGTTLPAQQFPPGYVDPAPILAAASKEIGESGLRCITYSGTGYAGAVGQTYENAVNIDWPRIDALANYTRTINWDAGTSVETFDRKPGLNPASWKYGLGWQDGTPTQHSVRQTHIVNGTHAAEGLAESGDHEQAHARTSAAARRPSKSCRTKPAMPCGNSRTRIRMIAPSIARQ